MALHNVKQNADVLYLDSLVIQEIQNLVAKKYPKMNESTNKLGYQLEALFNFVENTKLFHTYLYGKTLTIALEI